MSAPATRRWFQEPLVWLVISLPLSAVVAGFYTLWLAVRSADGLVVDDYYREGLAINRELARDERATALGLEASILLTATRFDLQLSAATTSTLPAQLKVQLLHPTRRGLDRTLLLNATAPGHYASQLTPLPAGRWHVLIEHADWRLSQRVLLP